MSRKQKRARLQGETDTDYQTRLANIRKAEAEAKRAKRERRPDESESDYLARLAQLRLQEAEARRDRRAASRPDRGDGRTRKAPTDGQKWRRTDAKSVRPSGGRTDTEMSVQSDTETSEITAFFDDVRPVSVRPVGPADVLPPSEGGGAGRTSAAECPSSRRPSSPCPSSPCPSSPCPSSPETEPESQLMPPSSAEESDRHNNVIALFADKRLPAPPIDYIEREEILWARIAQMEQRLAAAEEALATSQAAVRALQEAVVWLQSPLRRFETAPTEPAAATSVEATAAEDEVIHDASVDERSRAAIRVVWSYLCSRYVPGARATDALSELDVVALEQVWLQAEHAALGNRPRAEDLFYVWIERFLLDGVVPAAEKNPRGMCVRSHLFPRRLPEGLCEKWPPFPPEEDDYLQCFPFDAICVEWDQLVSASAGVDHVAAR